eukprot:7512510-Alexandrium_andersonii.AAC.1
MDPLSVNRAAVAAACSEQAAMDPLSVHRVEVGAARSERAPMDYRQQLRVANGPRPRQRTHKDCAPNEDVCEKLLDDPRFWATSSGVDKSSGAGSTR